jgi:uncharacterized repeat protein (TIGR01451 family)
MLISELFNSQFLLRGILLTQVLWAIAANAQESSSTAGLLIETIAERRVVPADEAAPVRFVAADQLHIGDEIFYTIRVRNISNATIEDVVVIKAVPRNTEYVADSAMGPATIIGFSTDGGGIFAGSDELEVTTPSGATRRASPSDYTHLRWQLRHPLAAGATALLRFRSVFK